MNTPQAPTAVLNHSVAESKGVEAVRVIVDQCNAVPLPLNVGLGAESPLHSAIACNCLHQESERLCAPIVVRNRRSHPFLAPIAAVLFVKLFAHPAICEARLWLSGRLVCATGERVPYDIPAEAAIWYKGIGLRVRAM